MSDNPLTDPTSYLAYRLANGKPVGRAGHDRPDSSLRRGGATGRPSSGMLVFVAAIVLIAFVVGVVAVALRVVFVGGG